MGKIRNIDLVMQYSLLTAGEEDNFADRQLGPIHLIKYVYLADLYYSRRNNGETFSGVDWVFHKFGPFTHSVNTRVNQAMRAVYADELSFESQYGKDDWYRWKKTDEQLLKEKEKEIPACITMHLKRDIRNFKSNTEGLLNFVYLTKPMLNAAPGELLDFSLAIPNSLKKVSAFTPKLQTLSKKQREKFSKGMDELRKKYRENWRSKIAKEKANNPAIDVTHDEVYVEGLAWLDSLAGPAFSETQLKVKFDESVWKSETRKGDELS